MGEVYRADDLKLGQAVALKFLPAIVESDPARLQRFLNEVKIARQVSHPNVCRVYDVGEVDGHHFLSMEFVDGEDLASLLRRIGRLPTDKAVQIARQLCAGLAAAHEEGILHRDLKPANVMIDGRGKARITDFGLAELAGAVDGVEPSAGTPAYMAPEQLAGRPATVRSDLYSLGLVLYELFTGHKPFTASTAQELARLQREASPTSPSSHVEGMDPAVERVILRSLRSDPAERPGSALAVAAALPGGDPLAAALAAGETPSPELVAAAGATGGLRPLTAWVCLALLAVGSLLVVMLSGRTQLLRLAALDKPPEVLEERARMILADLGYTAPPIDTVFGFDADEAYLRHVAESDTNPRRWERLAKGTPPALVFWYRQSPGYFIPYNRLRPDPSSIDPPTLLAGMTTVTLDGRGRLVKLEAVPPEQDVSGGSYPEPDWSVLLKAADLDVAGLRAFEPQWAPSAFADRRAAWEGALAGAPDLPVRIEAASYHGKPVSFQIIHSWTKPEGSEDTKGSLLVRISTAVGIWFAPTMLIGGAFLARRNLRLGRGDRKGALRLAILVSSLMWASLLLRGHYAATLREVTPIEFSIAIPLCLAFVVGTFYLALEPYLRRIWPQMIVSWVRLLDGRIRDPLVGRDVLAGLLLGLCFRLACQLYQLMSESLGMLAPLSDQMVGYDISLAALKGLRYELAFVAGGIVVNLLIALGIQVLLLLCRVALRKQWIAIVVFMVLMTIPGLPSGTDPGAWVVWGIVMGIVHLVFLFRFGLLSIVVGYFVAGLLTGYPLTLDASAWYVGNTVMALLVVGALAIYGARVALGRRSSRESTSGPLRTA
jgi:serine/threonine-protein kinase